MTLDQIRQLDDRELDRVIAEALGPTRCCFCREPWPCSTEIDQRQAVSAGYHVSDPQHRPQKERHYSTDLNACAEAEREVLIGPHGDAYMEVLPHIVCAVTGAPLLSELVTARPRERAEALAAVLTER